MKDAAPSVFPSVPTAPLLEPSLTLASTLLPDLPEDELLAPLSEPFHFWPIYQPFFPGPYRVSSSPAALNFVSDSAPA